MVCLVFRSKAYSPFHRNVSPDTRWSPDTSIRRPLKTRCCSAPKSSPTTATILTSVEERGGHAEVGRRTPDDARCFPKRSLDRIKRDGAHREHRPHRHQCRVPPSARRRRLVFCLCKLGASFHNAARAWRDGTREQPRQVCDSADAGIGAQPCRMLRSETMKRTSATGH